MKHLSIQIEQFRLKVAVNLFKRFVLHDLHMPNKPQSISLFTSLEENGVYTTLTERTWQSWFTEKAVIPKRGKMRELQRIAGKLKINFDFIYSSNDFEGLVLGGYLKEFAVKKHIVSLFNSDADNIDKKPSSLHLFLDAVELSTLKEGITDFSWENTSKILGLKILHELYSRWSPRNGYIYNHLPSDLKMKWDDADTFDREKLKQSFKSFEIDLFDRAFNSPPRPEQYSAGSIFDEPYQQIYKFLLSLADNSDFLKGYRLKVWVFDLATAAFAMHIVAWTERHKTFGINTTQEGIYWSVFYGLFVDSEFIEDNEYLELALIDACGAFNHKQIDLLKSAVQVYRNEIFELGIRYEEVSSYVMQIRQNHPMIFKA